MDNLLIALVIAAIAALSNWLQHRAQSKEDESQSPQPPRPATPPPMRRRLPPARPTATGRPELQRLPGQPPAPPRLPSTRGGLPPLSPLGRMPAGETHPKPISVPPPVLQPAAAAAADAGLPVPRVQFSESAAALLRAQGLHETVAGRLHHIDQQTERPLLQAAATPGASMPGKMRSLTDIAQDREAVRQAFIASLIFARPKGLEPAGEGP